MMTLIRPRHSPLHPDRFEALENTHSHSRASQAPVFQCVCISFNICISISVWFVFVLYRVTSHPPVFHCVCISFNICISISVRFIVLFHSVTSYPTVFHWVFFLQCLCFYFCSFCIYVSIIRKHSLTHAPVFVWLLICVFLFLQQLVREVTVTIFKRSYSLIISKPKPIFIFSPPSQCALCIFSLVLSPQRSINISF